MIAEISSPREGGLLLGFFDELDAASGARGDWRRDPGGYDAAAGDVRSEVPGVARQAEEKNCPEGC